MKDPRHQPSHGPSFVAIYLLISVAIAVAVFTLRPAPEQVSLELPDDERFIKNSPIDTESPVPTRDRDPNPPLPEPNPNLQSPAQPDSKTVHGSEPDRESSDKPAAAVVAATPAKPSAEPDAQPTTPTLTPEQEKEVEALYPFPQIRPLMEIVDHWRNIPETAFPKLIAILKPITFDMSQGGNMVARGKLPAGSMMVPIRLSGDKVILKTAGSAPIMVTVPVADTDLHESIQKRYDRFVEQARSQVLAQRATERARRLGAVAHEVELSSWNNGADPRFEPAKLSLQRGEVGTFSLLDAAKWRWGGEETVDGEPFDTAFVLIISEAAFGVVEKELKVFLKGGEAVRWIDTASGQAF